MKLFESNNFRKYFIPDNYYRFIRRRIGFNLIINRMVKPISFSDLSEIKGTNFEYFHINRLEYEQWVNKYYPQWHNRFGRILHNKLIQFFTTFTFLKPNIDDIFMDAAGAGDSYLSNIKCKKRYLHDIKVSQYVRDKLGNNIEYIESDAKSIPIANESIDKISCHHSFEHFQGNSDTLFINEVQRLLKPNGMCCIIPIFIGDRFIELTDAITLKRRFDSRSKYIIDPTSVLPGGPGCGNYARIYDLKAFKERIIGIIDPRKFKVTISELRLDGNILPDLTSDNKYVPAISRPFRSMMIERVK